MNTVALVPRRAGDPHRDRCWAWIRARWEHEHPQIPITEGHHDDGPFNRGAAINRAAHEAGTWDTAVIFDADSFVPAHQIGQAVELAAANDQLVHAFKRYCRLTRLGTASLLAGYPIDLDDHLELEYFESCSGALTINRRLWDATHGFDEKFVGWGWEDVAFAYRCQTFGGSTDLIVDGDLWHLWHERDENFQTNAKLMRQYRKHGERGNLRQYLERRNR